MLCLIIICPAKLRKNSIQVWRLLRKLELYKYSKTVMVVSIKKVSKWKPTSINSLRRPRTQKKVHMYWFGLTKSNLDFWMIFGKINSAVEKSRGWHLHSFVGVGLVRYLMIRQDTYSRNQISMGGWHELTGGFF